MGLLAKQLEGRIKDMKLIFNFDLSILIADNEIFNCL